MRRLVQDWKGLAIGAIASLLIWSYVDSKLPFIIEHKYPNETLVVDDTNKPVRYCRTVEYLKDVQISIDKVLVQHTETGSTVSISYPTYNLYRNKGVQEICKDMPLPNGLREGEWIARVYLTRKSFPFWSNTVEVNSVKLLIRSK